MEFICYKNCSTCAKARNWLINHNLSFKEQDIKVETPTFDEINNWVNNYNIDVKKLFNTSGLKYKELNLKEKLINMSEKDKIKLLSSDGMLIKRPILIKNDKLLIGFKENEWESIL